MMFSRKPHAMANLQFQTYRHGGFQIWQLHPKHARSPFDAYLEAGTAPSNRRAYERDVRYFWVYWGSYWGPSLYLISLNLPLNLFY